MTQLQFVRTLSADARNIVVGLVRNKVAAEKAFGSAMPKNLSFLAADITDLGALKVGYDCPIKRELCLRW